MTDSIFIRIPTIITKRTERQVIWQTKKKQQILSIYYEYDGRPGYRMMVIFLRRRGISLSRTTVLKYMRELKLRSVVIPQKPRYRKGDCYKKFNILLKQNFTAIRPNEKWCTDFTYFNLSDGAKRYNCSIIDLYDKSVLATLNSKRIDAELAIQTLQNFVRKKGFNRA